MTPMAKKLFVGITLCAALSIYVVTRPSPSAAHAALTPAQVAELQPAPTAAAPVPLAAKPPVPPEDAPEDPGLAPEIFEDGEGS